MGRVTLALALGTIGGFVSFLFWWPLLVYSWRYWLG